MQVLKTSKEKKKNQNRYILIGNVINNTVCSFTSL